MQKLDKKELLQIVGGIKITAALLSSIVRGINSLMELGRSVGSALRRGQEGKLCPIS